MSNDDNNWKWGQASRNAFNLVGQFFGIDPESVAKVKSSEVTKALKEADVSDTQVKMAQDYTNALKKRMRNSLKVGAMVHGLARNMLGFMNQQQQQEATTAREYAKSVVKTRTLSAKTNTAVEKAYLKGAKDIEKSGKDLQRYTGELNEQYQVIDETANQQSQQRKLSFRDRTQKRLAANSRPWRNY
jgi:3-methyladenine DNA glycosylase Tag